MSFMRPGLLEGLRKTLSRLRRRANNAGQIAVITGHAEKVITKALDQNNLSAIEKVGVVVAGIAARLPEVDVAPTNETHPSHERELFEEGLMELHAIEGVDAPNPLPKLKEARQNDDYEKMAAQRVQRERLNRKKVAVQVFCMHCPNAEPVTMTGVMRNYADLVWRRQMEPNRHYCRKTTKRKMKKYKVVPEVWIRRDGVHPWGSGRCWTYANLGDGVDHSTNKLDIVNAADFEDKKQDYMVLVWNEQDVEIPLPLGIPKFSMPREFCCNNKCETLRRHLISLLEQRAYAITLVGNIDTREEADGVLDTVFNNETFKHRRNDFYIKSG